MTNITGAYTSEKSSCSMCGREAGVGSAGLTFDEPDGMTISYVLCQTCQERDQIGKRIILDVEKWFHQHK